MDVTSLVIVLAIAGYVLFEYHRREGEQRKILGYLANGERPPEKSERVEGWKVFTTGGMALLLLGVTVLIGRQAAMAHPRYATPFIVIAGIGGVLVGIVGVMFAKNLTGVLKGQRTRKEK